MKMQNDCYVSPSVSTRALNAFLSHFQKEQSELHTLEIYEHGALLVRLAPAPYHCSDKREVYSLSKSFTSTAIGFLVDEGLLSEDDRIVDLFPEKCPAVISENLAQMRVRHVLSMNTGHEACVMGKMIYTDDAARAFLEQLVKFVPGTHFAYNTGATCLLSCIVEKLTGMKLVDYLSWKLFAPLGIDGVRWNRTQDGTNEGGCGLHVSCDDIAKLGLLYLNRGVWNGRRLLSERWVDRASSPISDNSGNGAIDWCSGYGYQFWMNASGGYRGDGAFGQLCLILPERDIVIAVQTLLYDMDAEMKCLGTLIEHLHDSDEAPTTPCLPDYSPVPPVQKATALENRRYRLDKNPMGFTALSVTRDPETDTVRCTFSDGVDGHTISAGAGFYAESTVFAPALKPKLLGLMNTDIPEHCRMVASYEVSENALKLYIRFLNCPHRLEMMISDDDGALHVHIASFWHLNPESEDIFGARLA